MKSAISYSRQSVTSSEDRGDSPSIAAQTRAIAADAERRGYRVIATYSDEDTSGAAPKRDGLDQMLAHCQRGDVDALIVYDISRLARQVEVFIAITTAIRDAGITFLSTREPTDEPWLAIVFAALAQRDREQTSDRTARGIREAVRRGKHHGYAPIGYTRQEDGQLCPNADAPLVVDLYRRAGNGETVTSLVRWLNERAIPGPRGGTWSRTTVVNLLRSPTYAGRGAVGRKPTSANGRAMGAVESVGHWEPLVDEVTWRRVQRVLAEVARHPVQDKAHASWLERRVTCAACGTAMYLVVTRSARHRDHGWRGERYWRCRASYYRALGDPRRCPATRHRTNNATLDRMVRAALDPRLRQIATPEDAIARTRAALTPSVDARRAAAEVAIKEHRAKLANLIAAVEAGDLSGPIVRERSRALEAAIAACEADIAAVPAIPDVRDLLITATQLQVLRTGIASMPDDALAPLAAALGLRVTLDQDAGTVTLTFGEHVAGLV